MRMRFPAALAAGLGVWAAGAARAGTVSLAGPATATPGANVTVSVQLSPDLTGVYALQGGISYDPSFLTPLPAQPGAPQGFYGGALAPYPGESIPLDADLFRLNLAASGRILFGYVKNPSNPAASPSATVPQTAVKVTFSVASGAKGTTRVAWTPYTVNGRDVPAVLAGGADGAPLDAQPGAALPISIALWGDANGDGTVDFTDVVLVMKTASGLALEEPGAIMENADVWPADPPDGGLNLEDAISIARMVSGPSEEG